MRETLIALYRLQEIDSRALEIDRMAEQIPKRVAELEASLETLRSELGTLRSEFEAQKGEQTESEAQIREEGGKTQKWKRRLNDIRTPREYQALSREVEQGERFVRDLEDKVVGSMEELEGKAKVIEAMEAELKEAEATTGAKVRELREQQAKFNAEARGARTGRDEIVAQLSEKLVRRYDRLASRRSGLSVVLATKGTCSGCNVAIRPQQLVEMRRLTDVMTCPSCTRILVLDSVVTGESE